MLNLIFKDREPWRNSCQSSIDFDVLFTALLTALFIVFEICGSNSGFVRTILAFMVSSGLMYYAAPVFSMAAVFLHVLRSTGVCLVK